MLVLRRSSLALRATAALALVASGALLAACGGEGREGSGSSSATTAAGLSAEARRGMELTRENGCTACHSADGRKSIGPTWKGTYGSEIRLKDGTTVTADDEYLTRSITDPNAQIREGYNGIMPDRKLGADDVKAIVAYLRELGGTSRGG